MKVNKGARLRSEVVGEKGEEYCVAGRVGGPVKGGDVNDNVLKKDFAIEVGACQWRYTK